MAVRANRKSKSARILVPATLHPHYRRVAHAHGEQPGAEVRGAAVLHRRGRDCARPRSARTKARTSPRSSSSSRTSSAVLEDVDALTDWAHARGILVIAVVKPDLARTAQAPGGVGCARRRHRRRRGPAARRAAVVGRPLLRLHDHAHGARAADAGPHRRPHARCRGARGLHADAAGARAAHPPRQGDLQHLHQPGLAGDGGHDLSVAHGAAGARAHGGRRARAHARAGGRPHARARRAARRSPARASTRRCCSSTARWPRCSGRSPAAASSAAWISAPYYPELGPALLVCATETKSRCRHRALPRLA